MAAEPSLVLARGSVSVLRAEVGITLRTSFKEKCSGCGGIVWYALQAETRGIVSSGQSQNINTNTKETGQRN